MRWYANAVRTGNTLKPASDPLHPRMGMNKQTGHVYTESTLDGPVQRDASWSWQPVFSNSKVRIRRRLSGRNPRIPRLSDLALDLLLEHLPELTTDMLCTIPYQLLLRLWKAVRRRRLITLHIFHQFAPLLRSEPKEIWDSCYKQTLQTPSSVLSIYIKPLHSDTFASIACLSITTTFPLAELVKLTSLRNLGVLAISNPKAADDDSTIGDRLVRAWHLAARDSAAFPVLRVLRIRHTAHLTPSSLDFINSFPALALYDVTGCPGFRHPRPEHARSLGWSLQVNQEVSDMFAIPEPPSSVDDSCRQKSIVDEYLLIGRSRREDDLARVGIDITDRIPIHDVFTTPRPLVRIQLGDPKDATLGASWQRYHGLSDIVCFTRVHASRSRASAHATSKAGTLGSRTLKRTSSSTAGVRLSKQVKLESIMGLVG